MRLTFHPVLWLALALALALALPAAARPVTYNRDVRPILSEHCFSCHGPDPAKREAGLRLDTFDGATGGDDPAIRPGDPAGSSLIGRITSGDPDEVMPPPDFAHTIDAGEADILRRWISGGAGYEPHWAYVPVKRPEPPAAVPGAGAVDAFLRAEMKRRDVEPAPPADPRVLMRRLSFDLTGLPPDPEEVAAYVADPSSARYAAVVERLLASRAHAERLATDWLDLVRHADSSGIASDEPVATQAYRAWVIRSFAENKRFDRFTREQLAGDLMADASDETLTGSAYNRLLRTNSEAGVIPEEALNAMKAEHVRGVSTVWLGSSIACAQCHDHKYDPFTARDYYRLAAFFDDLVETGVYAPGDRRPPLHYVSRSSESRVRLAAAERALAQATRRLLAPDEALDAALPEWTRARLREYEKKNGTADFAWLPAALPAAYVVEGTTAPDDERGRFQQAEPGGIARHMIAETLNGTIKEGLREPESGWYSEVQLDPADPPVAIAVQLVSGGYGRVGWRPDIFSTFIWGDEAAFRGEPWFHPQRSKRMGDLPPPGARARLFIPGAATFPPIDFSYEVTGMAWAQKGGRMWIGDSGTRVPAGTARRLGDTATVVRTHDNTPHHRDIHTNKSGYLVAAMKKPDERRSDDERQVVRRAHREDALPEQAAALRVLERELFNLRRAAIPTLVSKSGPPKTTRVLARGDFQDQAGPVVEPGIPAFMSGPAGGRRATRLDLADWIVSGENPLTARVFVNRLWSRYFGSGLNRSVDEFGSQGGWPTHPELLDWLAAEFVDSGWDVRHVIRRIVMSESYRVSSRPTDAQLAADPLNESLARQARFRLPAEAIRDSALASAGLLQVPGDPHELIYPYQPASYWDQTNKVMLGSRFLDYRASPGEAQYRRSLYTFWKRIGTHPSLLAFDAPGRQSCVGQRTITNTPGQALVLLNDPIFVEAARVLAARLPQGNDRARLQAAFSRVLARAADEGELELLLGLLAEQRRHFTAHPEEAAALLGVGQAARPPGDPVEAAAWAVACRVILNLHESITRN